jgi:hypothetical protein
VRIRETCGDNFARNLAGKIQRIPPQWGKRMLLDTSSQVHAEALPKLSELQAELIEHYKPIGPILA